MRGWKHQLPLFCKKGSTIICFLPSIWLGEVGPGALFDQAFPAQQIGIVQPYTTLSLRQRFFTGMTRGDTTKRKTGNNKNSDWLKHISL